MCIVIAVSIIKCQHQWRTPVTPILPVLGWGIKFFKSLFKVKHTIVTTQVEQVMAKVSSTCAMVGQDNQAWPRALCPPARKFHQPTVVEARSNEHPYLPTHELLLHPLRLQIPSRGMMDHQRIHYMSHQLLHARHHEALTGTRFVGLESVVVERKGPIDGPCGKDHRTGGSDIVGRVAGIGCVVVFDRM